MIVIRGSPEICLNTAYSIGLDIGNWYRRPNPWSPRLFFLVAVLFQERSLKTFPLLGLIFS
jgi:hypothetical protein